MKIYALPSVIKPLSTSMNEPFYNTMLSRAGYV